MRSSRNEEESQKMKRLIDSYVSNNTAIQELWEKKVYHDAFTDEFQTIITEVLRERRRLE